MIPMLIISLVKCNHGNFRAAPQHVSPRVNDMNIYLRNYYVADGAEVSLSLNNFSRVFVYFLSTADLRSVARLMPSHFVHLIHVPDQCSQVKDEGICPGNVPRFYFDQTAKRCLLFSYGGCGGNTNNFLTEESCIGACGGPSGALIHAIQLHGKLNKTHGFTRSNSDSNDYFGNETCKMQQERHERDM